MTQNNNQLVRNTEATINSNKQFTFEEVYAIPYVQTSLESILDQNIRRYERLNSFRDDIRQEILIHLNNELPKFDPNKSAIQTFARITMISGMRMVRRKFFSRHSSVLSKTKCIDDFENYDYENPNVGKKDVQSYLSHSRNTVDWNNQLADIESLIEQMPKDLQKITRALLEGDTVMSICRNLNIPNSTFRDKYLRQIRTFFKKNFFEKN